MSKETIIYRKNYKPCDYQIDSVHLKIDLGEKVTRVVSNCTVLPLNKNQSIPLVLDGEELLLKDIKINGMPLTKKDYQLDSKHLTISNPPRQSFQLHIEIEIKPQENTKLFGLYKSQNVFCTQCEPEGFRRITYFIDRPDNLSYFTTTISADSKHYPFLLSNGNLTDQKKLPNGRHQVTWKDPFRKPCYLFAMVAGDFDYLSDHFVTRSGKNVTLKLFHKKGFQDQSRFAMQSIKKAFKWDEENYGREYDLDTFMVVAIDDFNAGAMENKGLNIFNSKYIYADPLTATDSEYENIDGVIAHEYFHNWTGDRITCRDWFQLSLKEGLTVFRDQSFSEDITANPIIRIEEASLIRNQQFLEDAGPLAHPVRPDSYISIDNFYTSTVYDKGAEVIRMMKTILGKDLFRKGMDLYFKRHDGQAVTCDDFVQCMQDASKLDLTQFKLWYSQAGTPELHIRDRYWPRKKEYQLTIEQSCPATPGQPKKQPFHIPLGFGLLDSEGQSLEVPSLLNIKKPKEIFRFKSISSKPIPAFLKNFSAPIKVNFDYSDEELLFLMAHETDAFACWDATQIYWKQLLFSLMKTTPSKRIIPAALIETIKQWLSGPFNPAFIANLLALPSDSYLAQFMQPVDFEELYEVKEFVRTSLAKHLEKEFFYGYQKNQLSGAYQYKTQHAAKRQLKNMCLKYLASSGEKRFYTLAKKQFDTANNMTDQLAALSVLSHIDCPERTTAFKQFYDQWKHNALVIDKWFRLQATSQLPGTPKIVESLYHHPDFNIKNPNRVYSLFAAFGHNNLLRFNDKSGKGYEILTEVILKLDSINPHVGARLAKAFADWRRLDRSHQKLVRAQLKKILAHPKLSKDVFEIIDRCLSHSKNK